MGLGVDKDNFVTNLKPGTPAAEPGVGLQVGDRLLSVDGRKLDRPLAEVMQLADTHCFVVERLPPDTDSEDDEAEFVGGGVKGGILGASPSTNAPQELTSDEEEEEGEEWSDPTAALDHEAAAAAAANFLRRVESGIDD